MQNLTAPNGQKVMLYDSNNRSMAIPPTLINSYSILTIPAYFRAMRFISENLASFPRKVHKDGAKMEVSHPLDAILKRRPNAYQSSTMFWRTLIFQAAHTSNGFARIERAGSRPIALHNLDEGDVMPFRYDSGNGLEQWYYVGSTKAFLPGPDVIHLSSLGIDGMTGIDPIRLHSDTFQRAKTLDKYQTRFLMKGTVLKGAVQVPGSMTDEQFETFRTRLRSNFRGSEAEDDVLILSDGATLNNATMTSSDAQLIEQASYTTKQIGQITGVHPHYLFDDKDGKYNTNGEQAGIDVVKYTFRPWMELIDDELTNKLLTLAEQSQGYAVRMDAGVITRGDTTVTTNAVVAKTNAGLMTPNEGRQVLELPPDPDPKSDQLRLLGDTTPKPTLEEKPEPPKQNSALATGAKFATTAPATQWEVLEGSIYITGTSENATTFSVNIHQGGAVGKTDALTCFPPGSTIDTTTAAGSFCFSVGEHMPHAHENLVVPAITQFSAGSLPGNPSPVHLGHIARMAAGSKIMGMEPTVTVNKPLAPALTPVHAANGYAALRPIIDALCERIDTKTEKAFTNAADKTGPERTIWANVFSTNQEKYVVAEFGPVSEALVAMGGQPIDLTKLSERYGSHVRRRATTGEVTKLADIAKTVLSIEAHENN